MVRFGALEYRYRRGRLEWRVPGRRWFPDPQGPEDYAAVARLKDYPSEDEDEDDEAAA